MPRNKTLSLQLLFYFYFVYFKRFSLLHLSTPVPSKFFLHGTCQFLSCMWAQYRPTRPSVLERHVPYKPSSPITQINVSNVQNVSMQPPISTPALLPQLAQQHANFQKQQASLQKQMADQQAAFQRQLFQLFGSGSVSSNAENADKKLD